MPAIVDSHEVAAHQSSGASTETEPPVVTFVGALPPPVTGMTAITEVAVNAIEQRTRVRKFNWSRGVPLKGLAWKAARLWGGFLTLVRLPFYGRGRGAPLYYAVSSGWGLFYDMLLAVVGKVLGYRLVLHHHVYTYIVRPDWRVAVLDRLVGHRGAHVVYCDMMKRDFLRQYDSRASFLIVPPTIVSQQLDILPRRRHASFTLGFLSNLTFPKGLNDAIATFERLAQQGFDVRLMLAGPCLGRKVEAAVAEALAKWPDRIQYVGPVYGREKGEFYANLDAFLFPTRHRHESWGIVLTEALACGCPVIARCPGCVRWIVREGCGITVRDDEDFVDVASAQIATWINSPDDYQAAREAARRRSVALHDDAHRELPVFVDQLLTLNNSQAASADSHDLAMAPSSARLPDLDEEPKPSAPARPEGDVAAPGRRMRITFVGALPPPVTGMTAMTEVIVNAFERATAVKKLNWSRGKPLFGWRWKAARGWGALKSFVNLLFSGRVHDATLYYAVSSETGLTYDVAIAYLAKKLGYRLVLHHHSYTYINRRDWRAALLDRLTDVHAVHCELMREDFLRQYPSRKEFLFVPPTIVAQQMESLPASPHRRFTLGFLSILMMEKGLDEAIATFERLLEQGQDVNLILAGPFYGPREVQLVDAALARWPGRVECRGPAYGRDKAQFFADIDAFLFPTRYSAESWGIVLTEALAAGLPILARSRGCVKWIADDQCGLVVEPDADFVTPAAARITQWINSPEAHEQARQAARRRYAELRDDADRLLPEFVRRVVEPQGDSAGS